MAHVELSEPSNLTGFLAGFQYTAPALSGDMAAIERVGTHNPRLTFVDWNTIFKAPV